MAAAGDSSNCFITDDKLVMHLSPNPISERGVPTTFYGHPKEPRVIYGAGNLVVVSRESRTCRRGCRYRATTDAAGSGYRYAHYDNRHRRHYPPSPATYCLCRRTNVAWLEWHHHRRRRRRRRHRHRHRHDNCRSAASKTPRTTSSTAATTRL